MLSSLSNYSMSVIHLLNFLLRWLEKEFKAFLWGYPIERWGMHLVTWKNICTSKYYGGLGIISLFDKRKALFGKLATYAILNPSSLWAQLVSAKYGFPSTWHQYKKPSIVHILGQKLWIMVAKSSSISFGGLDLWRKLSFEWSLDIHAFFNCPAFFF